MSVVILQPIYPPPIGKKLCGFAGGVMGNSCRTRRKEPAVPVHRSKDSDGPYYQWGDSGKKYHYEAGNTESREAAKEKAKKQGRAARASGYDG